MVGPAVSTPTRPTPGPRCASTWPPRRRSAPASGPACSSGLGPVVRVVASDERSQARNRSLALERLRSRLAEALKVERERRPTAPTTGAQQRRLESKRRRSQTKRHRAGPTDEPSCSALAGC